ncbi:MAG: carboxylesterase family protein [Chlorobi bacterium]|nr:carboxylesterase family protein [Chlorobiota bacterium]
MKLLLFLLLSTLFSQFSLSQERYVDVITDSIEVATYTYASKQGENLMLDIYLPGNDYEEKRAVVIYVHGGGFRGGEGQGKQARHFVKALPNWGMLPHQFHTALQEKASLKVLAAIVRLLIN